MRDGCFLYPQSFNGIQMPLALRIISPSCQAVSPRATRASVGNRTWPDKKEALYSRYTRLIIGRLRIDPHHAVAHGSEN